jgi:pimeloyl-ACP methyl ester carboxylesterase
MGPAGNPDILLVHGWTSFASSWSNMEYFRDRYHVSPPICGRGESDKPQTGYRLRDLPKISSADRI